MLYLIVFLGAGIGGALRHGVNVGAARSQEDLRSALTTMAELLAAGHLQLPGFV